MKIAYVTDSLAGYHKIHAGAERACMSNGELMNKGGNEIVYFITTPDAEVVDTSKKTRVIKTAKDYTSSSILLSFFYYLLFDPISFVSSYYKLKEEGVDIVHIHHATIITLSVIFAAKLLGKPVVFSFYDYFPFCPKCNLIRDNVVCTNMSQCATCIDIGSIRNPTLKSIIKFTGFISLLTHLRNLIRTYAFKNVDTFIVLTATWKWFCVDNGIKEDKIQIVPLVVEVHHGLPSFTVNHPSILFVGWIYPHKGLNVLIDALVTVKTTHPNITLYVISADVIPDFKSIIDNTISKNHLESNVVFLGKSSYKEIHALLDNVDLVVVPEQWTIAWSIFLTEAMAHGRPIVASRIGDIAEFIQPEQTGLLANAKDPSDFAEKINELLNDPVKAQSMGTNARISINKITNEISVSGKLSHVYGRVMH